MISMTIATVDLPTSKEIYVLIIVNFFSFMQTPQARLVRAVSIYFSHISYLVFTLPLKPQVWILWQSYI